MKHLRDLLMDCRIELRTLVRDFHKTELCKRIDEARDALLHAPEPARGAAAGDERGSDRIAQAWQASAEDLRLTAPAIYDLLAKKVAQRLAAMPPDPVAEPPAAASVAAAAPAAAAAAADAPATTGLAAEQAAAPASVAADAHIPNEAMLTSIAASKRRFTEAQREWCVGEAMVRSGFSIDPEEFIARGDNEMARYILESAPIEE
jgi:hypothetical protein